MSYFEKGKNTYWESKADMHSHLNCLKTRYAFQTILTTDVGEEYHNLFCASCKFDFECTDLYKALVGFPAASKLMV